MKHKLYYFDGCMDVERKIDGEDIWTEEEVYTDNIKQEFRDKFHPLLKPILIKLIEETNDVGILTDLFSQFVMSQGDYKDLGQCGQCGDYNTEYNLEVEL